jgi:transcriptional regulator with XRE-family HTH domain
MEFTVEFYETETGSCPVREFLDEMKKTNFDHYLNEQLKAPAFAARFERAGEAWDVALQIAALRQQAGLSQKDLAKLLKITQQQISRLESPGYEGHSLSTLRRVAKVLHARVRVVFEPEKKSAGTRVAETAATYRAKRAFSGRARPKQGISRIKT